MTDQTAGLLVMTPTDWFGLILLVTLSVLLAGVYIYVLRPGSKAKMDKHRYIPLEDDRFGEED